ncbi:MAG: FHA domain-containing protein [Labilithrix sp.]|nr:FHA domain-containing protein [Labilithrix sp.]MCW5835116.1 FHA domain-containing protein [Labilithrix sp.]
MIEIVVTQNRRETTYRLEGAVSVIGRSRDAEVCIPDGTIARRHARLYERDGRIWIEDMRSTNGTWIDDARVQRARVEVGQRFRIALDAFVEVVRHLPVISPDFEAREAAFLTPIVRDPDDEDAREAYSAALAERGEHLRAQWLRAELALRRRARAPGGPPVDSEPYRELDRKLEAARRWRMLVGRPRIEGCARPSCATRWGHLPRSPGELDAVIVARECETCHRSVVYRNELDRDPPYDAPTPPLIAIDRLAETASPRRG